MADPTPRAEGLREALAAVAVHNHEEGGHTGLALIDCRDAYCTQARAALAASPTAPGTEDGIVMRGHVPTIRCWCGEDHDD